MVFYGLWGGGKRECCFRSWMNESSLLDVAAFPRLQLVLEAKQGQLTRPACC